MKCNKDKEIFRLNNDKKVIINENNKIQKENDELKANKTENTLENVSKDNKIQKLKELNEQIRIDLKYNIKAKKCKERELKKALMMLDDWSKSEAIERSKIYNHIDSEDSDNPDEPRYK